MVNFDITLSELQNLISAKILPSSDRIRELFSACRHNNEKAKVASCVADILRLEEEFPRDTPSGYKPVLILLSSKDFPRNPQSAVTENPA